GVRTPYARAGTELKDVPAADLGRIVVTELLARTDFDPAGLDEVIFGNIAQPPDAVNVSRVAALKAGVPERVPAFTVNRLCGSPACAAPGSSRSWTRTTGSPRATPRRSWPAASSRCRGSRCSTPTTARRSSPRSSRRGTSGGG